MIHLCRALNVMLSFFRSTLIGGLGVLISSQFNLWLMTGFNDERKGTLCLIHHWPSPRSPPETMVPPLKSGEAFPLCFKSDVNYLLSSQSPAIADVSDKNSPDFACSALRAVSACTGSQMSWTMTWASCSRRLEREFRFLFFDMGLPRSLSLGTIEGRRQEEGPLLDIPAPRTLNPLSLSSSLAYLMHLIGG